MYFTKVIATCFVDVILCSDKININTLYEVPLKTSVLKISTIVFSSDQMSQSERPRDLPKVGIVINFFFFELKKLILRSKTTTTNQKKMIKKN